MKVTAEQKEIHQRGVVDRIRPGPSPLLFLLIVNVVNFGGMMYAWIAVSNAARTGAELHATWGGATIGSPQSAGRIRRSRPL